MKLFWQGLIHDLSKYSITELKIFKYYTGKKSPHQTCREEIGYSPSWIHHYKRNPHHYGYWWDESELGEIIPIKMPYKYVIESFCDMIAAGKAYAIGKKTTWTIHDPLKYYETMCKDKRIMNEESEYLLFTLLNKLDKATDENEFFAWYNDNKSKLKRNYDFHI